MIVYSVVTSGPETHTVHCICSTKKIAERELFKVRDSMIAEWKSYIEWDKKEKYDPKMWEDMIDKVSGDDYNKWDNYPHETPSIEEDEVLDK